MISKIVNDFISFAKETSYLWVTSIIAYGASALQSDLYSDVVLIFDKNEKNLEIIKNCPIIKNKKYYATKFLPMTLPMIMYGTKVLKSPPIKYEKYELSVPDGGKVQAWICLKPAPENHKNVLLLNPGLTNGALSNYVQELCY